MRLKLLLAYVGAALLFYRPAFGVFFCLDDLSFLRQAAGMSPWPSTVWRLISTRGGFTAAWNLFETQADLYHLVIIILHGLCAWLVMLLGRRLGLTFKGAGIAGLLHLFSPVAFTSLHWISGGQEVVFAFFGLLTALFFLGEGGVQFISLVFFALTLLSKEAAVLLLPVLSLVFPLQIKRRFLLGGLGLIMSVGFLLTIEAARVPAAGNAYETAFGSNLIWTLLTHLAWLVRFWDFYPDRVTTMQPGLWPWGMLVPIVLALLVWFKQAWRGWILRASLVFLALLAPVLPLLYHSYHYYMLVPLIPLYLLAAAGVDRIPEPYRRLGYLLPVALCLLTAWQGHMRRSDMMNEALEADPVIRYARLVEEAVDNIGAAEGPLSGEIVILPGIMADESFHLSSKGNPERNETRIQFLMLERALGDVDNLRLFFPELESVTLVNNLGELPDKQWLNQEIYFNWGLVEFAYLGKGVMGCYGYAKRMFEAGKYTFARREIERILRVLPGHPRFISELGLIGVATGNQALVDSVLTDLHTRSETGPYPEKARQEHSILWDIVNREDP